MPEIQIGSLLQHKTDLDCFCLVVDRYKDAGQDLCHLFYFDDENSYSIDGIPDIEDFYRVLIE